MPRPDRWGAKIPIRIRVKPQYRKKVFFPWLHYFGDLSTYHAHEICPSWITNNIMERDDLEEFYWREFNRRTPRRNEEYSMLPVVLERVL